MWFIIAVSIEILDLLKLIYGGNNVKRFLCLLIGVIMSVCVCGCSFVGIENNFPDGNSEQKGEVASEVEAEEVSQSENVEQAYKMSDEETEEYIDVFIRPLYNSINESAEHYEKIESDGVTIWKSGGTIMKKAIPIGIGGNDLSREYYYDPESGELMFAFMYSGSSDEHRLYFKSGELIRYIDSSGKQINYPDVVETNGLEELAVVESAN